MKKIKKILVPVNFSQASVNAYKYVCEVGKLINAELVLLHVVSPEVGTMDVPVMAAQATHKKVETARELIQGFKDSYTPTDYKHNVIADIEVGGASSVISFVAERDHVDCILMGREAHHLAIENILGTTTTAVIEKAQCPVWVVPEKSPFNPILTAVYATDLYDADPFEIWKSTQWITPLSPILHVIHVNEGKDVESAKKMRDLENFFAGQAPTLKIEFHNLSGNHIAESILDYIELHEADLLIMYRPNRSWMNTLMHKSVTKKMAKLCRIPLYITKELRST
jgi:nucleotide-binding universal stress UspA family protein